MHELTLLITILLPFARSQSFNIGFLDQDVFTYINTTVYGNLGSQNPAVINFTVALVSLPDLNNVVNYKPALDTLQKFDVIIGRFNFTVATMCQQSSIAYFYLDNYQTTFPGALLEAINDLIMEAQMLIMYLNKYNINYPLRMITDGGIETLTFRFGLYETSATQCNFNTNDTTATINQCYQSLFKSNVLSNYLCISSETNTASLDTYMQQSLYMSLPYNSMMFFPVVGVLPLMTKYFYSGGFLLELTQEIPVANLAGTLLQRNALAAFNLVVTGLASYKKINSTAWIQNNVVSSYTSATILNIVKATNGIYLSNGQMAIKSYYTYVISSGSLTMVTTFIYNNSWTEVIGMPNPATGGSRGFINVLYITDSAFITEVNTTSGIVIRGYTVDMFNYLLTPIQLSYIAFKLQSTQIVGTLEKVSYTGMLGQMASGAYMMTAFPVPIVQQFRKDLTYSDPIFQTQYSMLIKKPEVVVDYIFLLKPYSPVVWIFIVGTIIILSIILFFTNMISPNMSSDSDKLSINNSVFMVFGSFLIAKMLVKPTMFSTQIFYLIIWLGTLLIIASYVANLVILTSFSNSTKIDFTNFGRLYNQKNYKWAFVNNGVLHNSIMLEIANGLPNATVYRQMYNYAKQNWPTQYIVEPENVAGFAQNNSNFGILNDAIHNMQISLSNCFLTTVIDTSFSISFGYVIHPSFQYSKDFANQMLLTKQSGIEDTLFTKYFQTGSCPTTVIGSKGISQFTYKDLSGIFILIVIGIVLSLIVAALEYVLSKCNLQCQRFTTGNSLQFGKIYRAKVKALDKNGVTVDIGRQSIFSRKDDARIYYVHKKFLGHNIKNTKEIPSPTEQGIMIGTTLLLKYLGNSPDDSKRKFIQVLKKK